jgi:hypothetical protein
MGVATLVRPQSLALAPLLGALAVAGCGSMKRVRNAVIVGACAIACCLPWTARNCAKMDRCALVSMNGGWNLLIGTATENGAWAPVDVPAECREVWSESEKDVCFERAARRVITSDPVRWIARAPSKIAVTLDYFGAAPWYLHASNAAAFPDRAKVALGAVETIVSRALLIAALVGSAVVDAPRRRARQIVAIAGVVAALTLHAWIGYFALVLAIALQGKDRLARAPLLVTFTAVVVVATALVHAVFFGAGRYGLVVVPFVTALAFCFVRARPTPPDASASRASSARSGSGSVVSAAFNAASESGDARRANALS